MKNEIKLPEEHFGPDNWAVSWLAGKHGAPHHDEASRAVALAMRAAFVAGFEQGREVTQQSVSGDQ